MRGKMENRELGHSGIMVGPLAFGGNVFGWTADEATSFSLLDAFVDAGLNLIDTADVYSTWVPGHVGGESESVIGNWLKRSGKRSSVVIATKVGKPMPPDKRGLSRKYIEEAVEASLRRLKSDYIDLYQSHEDDPNTPLDETMGAFSRLIEQGKVRAVGASNYSAERLSEALQTSRDRGLVRYESLQPEYNLYTRASFESKLRPICIKEGLGVIPYFSLAAGFLTGKYRSKEDLTKSPRGQGISKYLDERGHRILTALDIVSEQTGATPAQIALSWLRSQPGITAPIVSATTLEQWTQLRLSLELNLTASQMTILSQASD